MSWLSWIEGAVTVATAIKALLGAVATFVGLISAWWLKRQADAKKQAIEDAATQLKKDNEVPNATQEMAAKADDACKLEKLADPGSDCGS